MGNKIGILCYTTEEDTTLDRVGAILNDGYKELITIDVDSSTNLSAIKTYINNITKKELEITYIDDLSIRDQVTYVYAIDITGTKFSTDNFMLYSLSDIDEITDAIFQASVMKLIQKNTFR